MLKVFGLLAILLAVGATPRVAGSRPAASPSPKAISLRAISPDELFSRRALRRARLLIQMKVLQLRADRLERIREALLRQLPEVLWPDVPR